MLRTQRDELERKGRSLLSLVQAQIQDLIMLQQAVGELERHHLASKQIYEDEIRKLHQEIAELGNSL